MWLSLNVCTLSLLRVAACSLSLEAVHSMLVTISSQPAPSEASFLTTLYPWLHLSLYALQPQAQHAVPYARPTRSRAS